MNGPGWVVRPRRALRRITVVEWALATWYLVQGPLWGGLLLAFPPSGPAAALGPLLAAIAWVTILAGLIGTVGVVLTKQRANLSTIGLLAEQIGLLLFQAGNVSYGLAQVALMSGPHGSDRIALIAYVLGTSAAYGVREVFLVPRYLHAGTPTAATKVILH